MSATPASRGPSSIPQPDMDVPGCHERWMCRNSSDAVARSSDWRVDLLHQRYTPRHQHHGRTRNRRSIDVPFVATSASLQEPSASGKVLPCQCPWASLNCRGNMASPPSSTGSDSEHALTNKRTSASEQVHLMLIQSSPSFIASSSMGGNGASYGSFAKAESKRPSRFRSRAPRPDKYQRPCGSQRRVDVHLLGDIHVIHGTIHRLHAAVVGHLVIGVSSTS